MIVKILSIFGILCIAAAVGRLASGVRLPAILGWLVTGVVFGPYLVGLVDFSVVNADWYKISVKVFECFAGVMIGREIIFKKLAETGKQIIGITFIQSIGTFLFVSLVFAAVFAFMGIPVYVSFVFGGIALATAPAPALSIVNEYHTEGPVTGTLIPLAAVDDLIGVAVFFTVISVIASAMGGESESPLAVAASVCLPLVIGGAAGLAASYIMKKIENNDVNFVIVLVSLILCSGAGTAIDIFIFHSFRLNYILMGMAFSTVFVNLIPQKKSEKILEKYKPVLNLSLVIVIVNLGMPLDYRLISGAGVFTAVYIISRGAGKIGGAFLGGKLTKAPAAVTKYLGFTLLPHSGVSLVFTGIAATVLGSINPSLADLVQGTIVAAAIINEVIAVIAAKAAFVRAGEIKS